MNAKQLWECPVCEEAHENEDYARYCCHIRTCGYECDCGKQFNDKDAAEACCAAVEGEQEQ